LIKNNKILILGPDLNLSGGVANYYRILNLSSYPNISYFRVNSKSESLYIKPFRLIFKYFAFSYKLITKSYKIIHLNPSLGKRSFYRDALFIIISRLLCKKTLVFFRGWREDFEEKIKNDRFKLFLFKISYARASKYIVLSELFKKKLIGLGVPSSTTFFIETTVADSSFLQDFNWEKKIIKYREEVIFLFLSRIHREKGIYIAIDAYKQFLDKYPQRKSSFIIAGDGPELQKAKDYVDQIKIPQIRFAGHVEGDSKKEILLDSHVLLFPSYSEGMPNAILEGMLYGMPIISRITGGIADIVKQNINGFLSESLQPLIFTDFITILATNQELFSTMAINNHQKAIHEFTKEKVLKRLLSIYAHC
jgi:glycosyltransferase involved in cell wall biosynthesis